MRLTQKQLATWRDEQIKRQGDRCALCGEPFTGLNPPVADHDHTTGHLRGVLHRGCNSMLGHLENGRARYKLKDPVIFARFLLRVGSYVARDYLDNPQYPTHRTDDEKRLLRNKRARAARAKAKE